MSKLYFRYGAMNCGKSSALMQVAYNYEQNNKKVIVIKSEIDTKGNNYLESRIGLKRKVDILLKENESIEKYYDKLDELITICRCGKRAKFNARFINDKFTLKGDTNLIDGSVSNVKYIPLCGKCYLDEKIKYEEE